MATKPRHGVEGNRTWSFLIPEDLIARIQDAVYFVPGLTMSKIATQAFEAELKRIEEERGEPIPKRKEDQVVTAGRPGG